MLLSIPGHVKKVWDTWNLRGLIIVSLSLQIFLILFASLRKRRGGWIVKFIWLAYLLADWVAAVAIGLISSRQGNNCDQSPESSDILAFWAPFLLLHLGGPDTITSFALEDNELWVRHLLGLLLQVLSTIYVFLQSLPKNKYWLPAAFVFVSGIIKYAERTRALYLASLDHFGDSACRKPNAGPEYQRIHNMFVSIQKAKLPVQAVPVKRVDQLEDYLENQQVNDLDPKSTLRFAFDFFDTFKGLVAGLLISPQDRHVSREVFLNRSPHDVLEIIKIELSLLYEVLHTKVLVVRCKAGLIFRSLNLCCILGALLSFSLLNEHGFHKFDFSLTYCLLIGAIVLDVTSYVYMMFSDWTVIARDNWGIFRVPEEERVIKRRRWSESVSQYNFMTYCVNDYPEWINKMAETLRLEGFLDVINALWYRSFVKLDLEKWKFIFNQVKEKSRKAVKVEDGKRLCLLRGDGVLGEHNDLKWSIEEFEYTESLLLWHIATELCLQDHPEPTDKEEEIDDDRATCKLISNYMFYLLTMQPNMISTVSGNWKLVFGDTCAEIKRFLRKSSLKDVEEARRKILSVDTEMKPRALKGGISKSVLFDARYLAGELKKHQGGGYPWKLMSQVWVELLSYAAINCRPYVHAAQPSNGGELLTFVWLLMNHLGLGTQFSSVDTVKLKFKVEK